VLSYLSPPSVRYGEVVAVVVGRFGGDDDAPGGCAEGVGPAAADGAGDEGVEGWSHSVQVRVHGGVVDVEEHEDVFGAFVGLPRVFAAGAAVFGASGGDPGEFFSQVVA
jgi:hypothetical protein